MKFVFASDSFKGSLSSQRISELLEQSARQVFPGCETVKLAVADGGEGTADTVTKALGGVWRTIPVKGPLGEERRAAYGLLPGGGAIIEMAAASGLPLVPEEQRNPLYTTTFGVGQMIADALEQGCREFWLAIGGSATNDGGMGALEALGVRFLDEKGAPLPGIGASLERVRSVDTSGLLPQAREAKFYVLCDVDSPLTGEQGAAFVFAPQKGADAPTVVRLDRGLCQYADVAAAHLGQDLRNVPGAGAAGGLGFGLMAFLQAQLRPGVEAVLNLLDFDRKIKGADLVVTGEGRMDSQSARGKVPAGVGKRCLQAGVPAVAIAGSLGHGYEAIYDCGIRSVVTTVSGIMPLQEAMERAEELYRDAARRLFSLYACGAGKKENPDSI